MFFVTNHAADQRETLLLQNDTTHAAALASSAFENQVALLDALAATATTSAGSPTGFLAEARQLVHSPLSTALGKAYLAHFVIFASVGPAFRTGQELPEEVALATHVAETSAKPGVAVIMGRQGFVDLAAGAPMVPDGNIVLVRVSLAQFIAKATGPSFSDLRMALYGSTHPAAANLLASEGGGPVLGSPVTSAPVRVGNETWTLVANARSPLVGDFAAEAPLIVLLLGLLVALLSGGIVELLVRRRQHVLAGVDRGMRTEPPVSSTTTDSKVAVTADSALGVPADSVLTTPPESEVPASVTTDAPWGDGEGNSEPPAGSRPSQDDWGGRFGETAGPHADWRPDPFGRFQARRFFLDAPTSVVRNGVTESYDPVAPLIEKSAGTPTPAVTDGSPCGPPTDDLLEANDRALSDDRSSGDDSGDQDATIVQPLVDTPEALETLATGVGRAVAEEIEELRIIATEIGEYSAKRLSESSARDGPPVGSARSESRDEDTIQIGRREPIKSLAMASGALGLASLLWKRRKRRN